MGQAGRGPRGKKFGLVENHTSVLRIDVVFPLPPTLCHEDASTRRHREGPRFLEATSGARGLLEHGGGAHEVRAEWAKMAFFAFLIGDNKMPEM